MTSHTQNQWQPGLLAHLCVTQPQWVNSLRPSDACMHHRTRPSLVKIMAHHLIGAKPLSVPMMVYCHRQMDPWEHISVEFESKYNNFHWIKLVWKCCLQSNVYFALGSMCWVVPGIHSGVYEHWHRYGVASRKGVELRGGIPIACETHSLPHSLTWPEFWGISPCLAVASSLPKSCLTQIGTEVA